MAPVKKAKDHTTHLQHPIRVAVVIVDATPGGMLRVLVRDGGGWDYDLGGGLTEVQTDKTASFELAARKHAGIDYPHLNRTGTQMRLRIWKVKQNDNFETCGEEEDKFSGNDKTFQLHVAFQNHGVYGHANACLFRSFCIKVSWPCSMEASYRKWFQSAAVEHRCRSAPAHQRAICTRERGRNVQSSPAQSSEVLGW